MYLSNSSLNIGFVSNKVKKTNKGETENRSYLGLLNEASHKTEYFRLFKETETQLNDICQKVVRDTVFDCIIKYSLMMMIAKQMMTR